MKLVTLEKAKYFYKEVSKEYHEFISYLDHKDPKNEIDAIVEFFDTIGDQWSELELDHDPWYEGDRIISEALGEVIRYWNTDVMDQLHFCQDLVELLGFPELLGES